MKTSRDYPSSVVMSHDTNCCTGKIFTMLAMVSLNRNNGNKDYCKIVIEPTDEELELHKNFLKKEIKKNYY